VTEAHAMRLVCSCQPVNPSGRDALHASQRCSPLVDLKRDRVKETHAMRLYALPT